ncbi:MAG: type II CAAX endopeptidase family protein, partial [Synergistaceae bacterium]|nr:type II CAAX endopeptidase family protein [Synergistaceae bacterium]
MSDYRRAGFLLLGVAVLRIAAEFVLPLVYKGSELLQLYALSTLLVSIGAIYLPTLLFMRRKEPPAYGRLRVNIPTIIWSVLLGWGLFQLSSGINALLSLGYDALGARSYGLQMPPTHGWRLPAVLLLLTVVPAITEEQFFRGALLSSWRPMGRCKASLLCAIVFSLMHFQPLSIPAILLIGYVIGIVAFDTGSVYPAMIVHGVNNLAATLMSVAGEAAGASAAAVTNEQLLMGIASYIVFGSVITVLTMRRLRAVQKSASGKSSGGSAPAEEQGQLKLHVEEPRKRERGLVFPLSLAFLIFFAMNAVMLAVNFGWIK